ncbi:MAG: hypothetical protein QXG05_02875 [Nitrososphaerota archaeon]
MECKESVYDGRTLKPLVERASSKAHVSKLQQMSIGFERQLLDPLLEAYRACNKSEEELVH